jgi:hypothetical protein
MRKLLLVIVGCFMFSGNLWADSVSYELTGFATGNLSTTSFTNAVFTLTATGASSGLFQIGPGIFANPLASVSLTVSGVGTFQVVDPFYIYVNQSVPGAGFIDVFRGDVLDFGGKSLSSWNGIAPLGPISVNGTLLAPFKTTGGLLILSSTNTLEFSSSQTMASTPEPASVLLVMTGLLGVVAIAWQSRAKRNA